MKIRFVLTSCASLAIAGSLGAADASDLFTKGKVSLNFRARSESVSQTSLRDAQAITLRSRVGYTTGEVSGFKAMVEGENIAALDGDRYSQSGLNPAATGRAVIADPEITELNQAWIGYTYEKTSAIVGRQRFVLDNARFIGDSGWRQDNQTVDAITIRDTSFAKTTLTYAYLDRIHRVFGRHHPQGRWNSDSHVFNASRAGLPAGGTLTAYGYLLDFKDSTTNSCATWGAAYAGTAPLSPKLKLAYRAELATQADYGSNKQNYRSTYTLVEAGAVAKAGSASLGYEVLGSDRNVGFKTPLATLHSMNGWADLFLNTPAAGLRDTYVKATANLPEGFGLTAFYHWFDTDAASTKIGHEIDAVLTRAFGKSVNALVKVADFRRDSPAFPNVRKFWLQVEYTY